MLLKREEPLLLSTYFSEPLINVRKIRCAAKIKWLERSDTKTLVILVHFTFRHFDYNFFANWPI